MTLVLGDRREFKMEIVALSMEHLCAIRETVNKVA